jgi:hypothetical protein
MYFSNQDNQERVELITKKVISYNLVCFEFYRMSRPSASIFFSSGSQQKIVMLDFFWQRIRVSEVHKSFFHPPQKTVTYFVLALMKLILFYRRGQTAAFQNNSHCSYLIKSLPHCFDVITQNRLLFSQENKLNEDLI